MTSKLREEIQKEIDWLRELVEIKESNSEKYHAPTAEDVPGLQAKLDLWRRALEAMPEWRSIKNSPPKEGQKVLLRWRETGHIEDGDIRYNDNGDITHCLFDGERLNAEPTEWMPTPPTDSAGN